MVYLFIDGDSNITGWWLSLPLWKIWKSIGIIIPNIWKNKKMFQATNQFMIHMVNLIGNYGKMMIT